MGNGNQSAENATAGDTRPGILFNILPKSGSIFISRWLANGLGLEECKIAVCLFPNDLVMRDKLDKLAAGGALAQQHLPALDINLRFIANRFKRIVIHVRDPRQATLSWVYHLDNFHAHRLQEPSCALGLEAVSPSLPGDYFERSLERKIDYQLDAHYPILLQWITDWTGAQDFYGLDILYTSYEEFVANERVMIGKVLAHFDISSQDFDWTKRPEMTPQNHFRKGEIAEWKSLFTADQIHYANSRLADTLCQIFGWQK